MTAIMGAFLGASASSSPEVFVSGVGASTGVGFVGVQGGTAVAVSRVSATASVRPVTVTANATVTTGRVSATASVSPVADVEVGGELPDGTILFFDRPSSATAIPTGFSLYTEFSGGNVNNYLIKGGTSASRVTGTSAPVSFTAPGVITSPTDGAHGGSPNFTNKTWFTSPSPPAPSQIRYGTTTNGGHTHTVTLSGSATYPEAAEHVGIKLPLIRPNAAGARIPQNAIVFRSGSNTAFTGFTKKTWGTTVTAGLYTINANPSPTAINAEILTPSNVGPQFGRTVSTAPGAHNHGTTPLSNVVFISSNPQSGTFHSNFAPGGTPTAPTSHNHGGSANLTQLGAYLQFKCLMPCVANSEQSVVSGMIVMYTGPSVPSGWQLCDGTNSTPNMVNFLLGFENTRTTSPFLPQDATVFTNTIGGSANPVNTGNPPTQFSQTAVPVTLNDDSWTHDHALGPTGTNYTPSVGGAHLSKSVPHSHPGMTYPAGTFNMPTSYIPRNLTVMFIQKV